MLLSLQFLRRLTPCFLFDNHFTILRIRKQLWINVPLMSIYSNNVPGFQIYMGFALESGSIFKESFERSMGWTRPFHLPALWEEHDMYYDVRLPKRAWWRDTGQMDKLKHSAGKTDDDLTLKHISGAFYSLVGCLVISGIVFIYEMLYYYRKKQRKKVRSQFKIGNKSTAVDDFGYSNRDGFHY